MLPSLSMQKAAVLTAYLAVVYSSSDFALTPPRSDHTISPESSDGFASVGTILPKEKATLLPGGLFALRGTAFPVYLMLCAGKVAYLRPALLRL